MSAGEASGDLHAGVLADAIRCREPDIRIVGMGGSRMAQAGVELLVDIGQSSVVGITEVVRQIPEFLRKRATLRRWMENERPNALICVDFPDFNLRLAADARRLGVPVVYHIPPKAWAWRPRRGIQVAEVADAVSCLFGFEAEFYRSQGARVAAVGHPLVDVVREAKPLSQNEVRRRFHIPTEVPVLGLLPGSRRREVARLLQPMVQASELVREAMPELRVLLPKAATVTDVTLHESAGTLLSNVLVVSDATYDAIRACDFVLAASGTVTLEAALLGVPMAVVYRLSALTFALAKRLVRVPYSGLPNLIAGREILPELLQSAASAENMARVALSYLRNPQLREAQRQALGEAMGSLGEGGAVERVADVVLRVARREALP
jgi:lipid-A-disaccharide synthase